MPIGYLLYRTNLDVSNRLALTNYCHLGLVTSQWQT